MATVINVTNPNQIDPLNDIKRDLNRHMNRKTFEKVETKVLEKMDEIKNRQTRQGNSPAKGGRYNNRYNRQYARREKGGRRSPVTLRNNTRSIEQTRTVSDSKGTELQFRDRRKSVIFYYHDTGTAKGGKFRQIYPDSDNQVPEALDVVALNELYKILQK